MSMYVTRLLDRYAKKEKGFIQYSSYDCKTGTKNCIDEKKNQVFKDNFRHHTHLFERK